MVFGRHRGLPLDVDTTTRLPDLKKREEEIRKTMELPRNSARDDTTIELGQVSQSPIQRTPDPIVTLSDVSESTPGIRVL